MANYKIPHHGTKIKHPAVENPKLVVGGNGEDVPGCSPIAPNSPKK